MEETKNTPAIILNRQDYREQDVLVTVYTRDLGKRTLVARGAKKPGSKLAGHVEPLAFADILVIKGKARDYIGSALTRRAHQGIRTDLNKLYYAGQAIGLFSRLVKDEEIDKNLFLLLVDWLAWLENFIPVNVKNSLSKEEGTLLLSIFLWKLISQLGYQPNLDYCLKCRQGIKSGSNHFDLGNGGLVCGDCFNELKNGLNLNRELLTISDNCVKIIRFIIRNDVAVAGKLRMNRKLAKELFGLINSFINFHL